MTCVQKKVGDKYMKIPRFLDPHFNSLASISQNSPYEDKILVDKISKG